MNFEERVVDGVACQVGCVRLELSEEVIARLVEKGEGCVSFGDVQVKDDAKFIAAWWSGDAVVVAFHSEVDMPLATRKFILAPTICPFARHRDTRLDPLGIVLVTMQPHTILFALYEVTDVRRDKLN